MDWTPVVTLVLGGLIGLGSSWLQWRRQAEVDAVKWSRDRGWEDSKWIREERRGAYGELLVAFTAFMDALHYNLEDTHDEFVPDPVPSVAEAQRRFEVALAEVHLFGPERVTPLADQLRYVTWHFQHTVGEGGVHYYRHWDKVRELQSSYIEACRETLGVDAGGRLPPPVPFQEWREDWIARATVREVADPGEIDS